jgi:hypothetical protein
MSWIQKGSDIIGDYEDANIGFVSISNDGNTLAIGEPNYDYDITVPHPNVPGDTFDVTSNRIGRVRVFDWNGSSWVPKGGDIIGENARDESGFEIDMSADGNTIAVGARFNDGDSPPSTNRAGHVRVYDWHDSPGEWVKRGEDIDGEMGGDQSGRDVSLSADGNTVAIGAISYDRESPSEFNVGHVRIFDWHDSPGAWEQRGDDIEGERALDQSGISVSLSCDGNIVAIGAMLNDGSPPTNSSAGHVRVFEWHDSPGEWVQRGDDIDGDDAVDQMGRSVALSCDGNTLVVGARRNDNGSPVNKDAGHVRVFDWDASPEEWVKRGEDIEGVGEDDWFGYEVSISSDGNTIAVGAIETGSSPNMGYVKIYTWNGSAWVELVIFEGDNDDDEFGHSVTLSRDGKTVAIAAPNYSAESPPLDFTGLVRVFEVLDATTTSMPETTMPETTMPPSSSTTTAAPTTTEPPDEDVRKCLKYWETVLGGFC